MVNRQHLRCIDFLIFNRIQDHANKLALNCKEREEKPAPCCLDSYGFWTINAAALISWIRNYAVEVHACLPFSSKFHLSLTQRTIFYQFNWGGVTILEAEFEESLISRSLP